MVYGTSPAKVETVALLATKGELYWLQKGGNYKYCTSQVSSQIIHEIQLPSMSPRDFMGKTHLWEHGKGQYKIYDAANEIELPIFLPKL